MTSRWTGLSPWEWNAGMHDDPSPAEEVATYGTAAISLLSPRPYNIWDLKLEDVLPDMEDAYDLISGG